MRPIKVPSHRNIPRQSKVLNTAELFTPLTFTFSATSLNLGFEQLGVTSPAQTVTVTNASLHSAAITSVTKSGDYAETNNCVGTLNPGKPCTITVTFTPTTTGTRNGAVTLNDNAPGSPQALPETVRLTPSRSRRPA